MKLVFVCWPFEDQGSGNIIQGYTEAARALGHEVTVYACPNERIPLNYSLAVESADALVFLFEWTTRQYYGDRLDLVQALGRWMTRAGAELLADEPERIIRDTSHRGQYNRRPYG